MDKLEDTLRIDVNAHLYETRMGEGDIDAREWEGGGNYAQLRRCLLVSSDLCTVFLDLRGCGDERDQKIKSLPERDDIIVNLEE